MSLSCSCYFDGDGYFWTHAEDVPLPGNRRKRCCSCNVLIELKALSVEFHRRRPVNTLVEEKIYGEDGEIDIASYYMCETCGDLFWSLDELGFCIYLSQNMKHLVKEYAELYGKNNGH